MPALLPVMESVKSTRKSVPCEQIFSGIVTAFFIAMLSGVLKEKAQVFLSPVGDHYRTRLTHTLEVSQIARTIARALRLNEDLTEAIALGHDLGHSPFGHSGEAMDEYLPDFKKHYLQSVRVVDYIEKKGQGLNLTYEVKNGIACHTNKISATAECRKIIR